jgi:hypothetical protein
MINHILVGLGGTGGKILREFKKRMYEEYPSENERNRLPISLVYVDTTREMMDQRVNVMGLDASFTENEFLNIRNNTDVTNIINNIANYPKLKGIVDNVQGVRTAIGNLGEAAGQLRRAGRLLFCLNADRYVTKLQDAFVHCHEVNPENNRVVHIFAGLSGGTGSGSIIDAIAQTRKLWRDAKILVYVMLPERDLPKPGMDKGRYYPNAYAALTELNALQCGAYQPGDVTGNGEPLDCFSMNPNVKGVADGIIVYGNVNSNGYTVNSLEELPRIVSDYAYARIFLINQEAEACNQIIRAYNFENLDGYELELDETVPAEEIKADRELPKSRTRKVSSFAIKRVIYPELRVLKHITYSVGEAVLNQFKYNKWTENNGYVDEAPNKDYRSSYVTKEKCDSWKIDTAHLTQEKTVLPNDANYSTFLDDWQRSIDDLSQSCANDANPLSAISDCMNNIYQETFRDAGVEAYYNNKRRVFKDLATEMRQNVEKEIYNLWRNGELSATDMKHIVEVVYQYVSEDLKDDIQAQIVRNDEELNASTDELNALRQDWAGVALNIFRKRQRIYSNYCTELAYNLEAKTKTAALRFAADLQQVVNREFGRLVEDVTAFVTLLTNATDSVRDLIVAQRRTNPGLDNVRGAIIEVCEDNAMTNFEQDYKLDEVAMRRTSQQLREAIIGNIEFLNFADLTRRISVEDIQNAFDTTLAAAVEARHEELPNAATKVLGLNILSQLQQQLDSEQAMKDFAKNLLNQVDPFVSIDDTEIQRNVRNNAPAIPGTNINLRACLIAIPAPDGDDGLVQFADRLERAFKNSTPNRVEVFRGSPRRNELYIITINSGYPMRAISWLKDDKRKFDNFLHTGNPAQDITNSIMLFGEGTGKNLPNLFALSNDELKKLDEERAAKKQQAAQQQAAQSQTVQPQVAPAVPGAPTMPPMPPMPSQEQAPQVQLFLALNGVQYGPYDYATCQTLVKNGQLNAQTLVWEQGMTGWTPAGQVAKLQALFAPAMPQMPPLPPMGGQTPPPLN